MTAKQLLTGLSVADTQNIMPYVEKVKCAERLATVVNDLPIGIINEILVACIHNYDISHKDNLLPAFEE